MKEAIYNFFSKIVSKVILFFKRLAVKRRIIRMINRKKSVNPDYKWPEDAEVAVLITRYYTYLRQSGVKDLTSK